MEIKILHRTPDLEHTTIMLGEVIRHTVTTVEYTNIIKPATRVEGTGADYIIARNKILEEYFINGPKEQFSW
jgi:hypothetical protein